LFHLATNIFLKIQRGLCTYFESDLTARMKTSRDCSRPLRGANGISLIPTEKLFPARLTWQSSSHKSMA
jgi:hypothetical protein